MSPPRAPTNGIAFLGTVGLVLLSAVVLGNNAQSIQETAVITVEHTQPLSLSLTVKQAPQGSLFDIGDATDLIHVSVPERWKRREVRGVPIATVTAEGEGFGFTRWRLPKPGRMTFFAPISPSSLILHNPSPSHLTLKITLLDLEHNHTETRTILIDKGDQKVLW